MATDSTVGRHGTLLIALACFAVTSVFLALLIGFAPAGKAEAAGSNVSFLDQELTDLRSRVSALESRVATLEQNQKVVYTQPQPTPVSYNPPTPTPHPYPSYPPTYPSRYPPTYPTRYNPAPVAYAPGAVQTGSGRIDQNGEILNGGWTSYFTGHGFGADEEVTVTSGGSVVATAETDGGGSFSAAVPIPSMPGTYSYTFVGSTSGVSATATITSSRTIGHVQF